MNANLFPLGIAEGEAFCNRAKDRKELASNIRSGNHIVFSAPRRYGKSSLIKKVVTETKIPYTWIDFLTVSTKEEVQTQIAKLVAQAIYAMSPDIKKIQQQLAKLFKGLGSEINFGIKVNEVFSSSIAIHPDFEKTVQIDETLMRLDELAAQLNKRVVFVFDEFQQISLLKDNTVIEGMIRHAVERSKAITYIFSGSNRHLLQAMFSSSNRPLYKLCQTATIERIAEEEYKKFLMLLAKKKWGMLPDEAFEAIMFYSERHPFYVNAICNKLWKDFETAPTKNDVGDVWNWFTMSNKANIISDIIELSANQKRIITHLAQFPTSEIRGHAFLMKTKLAPSSIVQSVESLQNKDIIFQDKEGIYKLLDPAVRHYLLNH